MTARDMVLAALTSVAWGLAFVAIKLGLESFSAPQLTAARFLIACLPVLWVPRPRISWATIVLIGLTLFTGQFMLLFFAYTLGMPPGLASVSQQMQAFFTVLLAAVFLRDVPTRRQAVGMVIAFCGLALIGLTAGGDFELHALGLALAGALSWAIGNVLVKRTSDVPVFPIVVWSSLVPPVPALLFSHLSGEQPSLLTAVTSASWLSVGAAVYLGVVATILAYGTWGRLLQRYPAAAVAPFALLAPCTGVLASALVFREVFSPMRYAGMALILGGFAVIVLRRGPAESPDSGRQPRRAPGGGQLESLKESEAP
jgi:O-acetylserine/cysteine efflux transporter